MDIVHDSKVQNKIVQRLTEYIRQFEKSGVPFEKIFNNDKIKYDYYGKGFYCFKMHLDNRRTYRLLYRFLRNTEDYKIEPHLLVLKRDTNKCRKDYINYFEGYVKNYKG